MTLAIIAAVLFAAAAAGGVVIAIRRFRGRPTPPMGLALGHGAVAAIALVVYLVAIILGDDPPVLGLVSLGLFIVAALGGFALFSFHLRDRALPIPLMLIHAGVAVIAFVLLVVAILVAGDLGNGSVNGPRY